MTIEQDVQKILRQHENKIDQITKIIAQIIENEKPSTQILTVAIICTGIINGFDNLEAKTKVNELIKAGTQI